LTPPLTLGRDESLILRTQFLPKNEEDDNGFGVRSSGRGCGKRSCSDLLVTLSSKERKEIPGKMKERRKEKGNRSR
jgi:hypothetical protein